MSIAELSRTLTRTITPRVVALASVGATPVVRTMSTPDAWKRREAPTGRGCRNEVAPADHQHEDALALFAIALAFRSDL
jgi:hypothetical protein